MDASTSFASTLEGPPHAPVLVLLHALATSAELWAPQRVVWRKRFRLLSIDLPGHGASAPLPVRPDMGAYADGVALAMDRHGIERAALAGISLGAMVAQAFALRHPERCTALVLAHAGARTTEQARELWQQRIVDFRLNGFEYQAAATLGRWFTPAFARTAPLTMDWIEGLIRATHADGYTGAIQAIQQLDHLERLDGIRCPALVIAGEHDQAVPASAALAVSRAIPGACFEVLRDAAHLGNIEQAAAFTELAGGFLLHALQA
jgi:3-oxoadipate enol-lactonase